MPTLNWIGKSAVVDHHREVPFRVLREVEALSVGDPTAGNLLIQGDSLHALKALLPYYSRGIKCIYIDPPYNTGNEGWVYNDNVNSPEIHRWLGEVVGKEAEDLSRHDKWLCMMYPRLVLMKKLLREDGVIFISIGRDEVGHLRLLCDEIFGPTNLLEIFIWQIEGNTENQDDITSVHEYVLAYAANRKRTRIRTTIDPNVDDNSKLLRDFAENSLVKNGPANPASVITLPAGFPCQEDSLDLPAHEVAGDFMAAVDEGDGYIRREMKAQYGLDYPVRLDPMIVREGALVEPCRVYSGWSSARKLRRFIDTGCTPLIDTDGSTLQYFLSNRGVPTYRRENREGHFVPTILRNMGTTETSSNELERMGVDFDYPKPVPLIEHLISLYAEPGDVVLDAFAGSGTTGHAALRFRSEVREGLRWVLIELSEEVAKEVTAPRLRAVVNGYTAQRGARTQHVAGLGGGFRYCELGPTLFDESGQIRDEVAYEELARHVFITETGRPLLEGTLDGTPRIGIHEGAAIYLLYNGILGDLREDGGNVLTKRVLNSLPPHDGPRIIYAERSLLDPVELRRLGVTFKQTPYNVRTS